MRSVKYPLLLCFSVFFPFTLFCQKTYQFRLIDQVSKQPVPYATVGLLKQNTGASTDAEGMLSLKNVTDAQDSIMVSCLGYEMLRFSLSHLSLEKPNVFELKPQQYALQEIIIRPEKFGEPITLNQIDKKRYKIGHFVSNYSSQVARKFTIVSNEATRNLIKSVSYLMKRFPHHQISNFRVRIYKIDPLTGGPGADLLTSPIIRTVTKNDEVIKVDLQQYRITGDLSSFFVAVEWLKTDANAITMNLQDQTKSTSYLPLVGVRHIDDDPNTAWILNYKNEWLPMHRAFSRDLAISAEVVPISR